MAPWIAPHMPLVVDGKTLSAFLLQLKPNERGGAGTLTDEQIIELRDYRSKLIQNRRRCFDLLKKVLAFAGKGIMVNDTLRLLCMDIEVGEGSDGDWRQCAD